MKGQAPLMSKATKEEPWRDDYETPPELFAALDREFNFTLDPCASPSTAKCDEFYTLEQNGLAQPWHNHSVFVNPPYSRQDDWFEKAYAERGNCKVIVFLIPARTDTRRFHKYLWDNERHQPRPGVEIRFLKGRVKFLMNGERCKSGAGFPSMIVVIR